MQSGTNNFPSQNTRRYIKNSGVEGYDEIKDKYKRTDLSEKELDEENNINYENNIDEEEGEENNKWKEVREDRDLTDEKIKECGLENGIFKDIRINRRILEDTSNIAEAIYVGEYEREKMDMEVEEDKKRYLDFERGTEEYKDINREFKDVMTDLTTKEFFKSQNVMEEFIKLVFVVMNNALIKYKKLRKLQDEDIIFIYKGGNALKTIYMQYMYETPGAVSDILYSVFSKYLKKSDADFQIYINPRLEESLWERVYDDMQNLSYLVLNRIRNIFILNLDKYFDFYKYNLVYQQDLLRSSLDKLNKVNITQDEQLLETENYYYYGLQFSKLRFNNIIVNNSDLQNIDYDDAYDRLVDNENVINTYKVYLNQYYRHDMIITEHPDIQENDKIIIYKYKPLSQSLSNSFTSFLKFDIELNNLVNQRVKHPSEFYITLNNSIYSDLEGFIIKFALVRLKCNFTGFFTALDGKLGLMNIPGELIDISIPHKDSTEMLSFYDHLSDYLMLYNYSGRFDLDKSFSFISYTPLYFIKDLHKMLFRETLYPWTVDKYDKRIYRLMFLYIIDLLNLYPHTVAVVVITDLISSLNYPTLSLSSYSSVLKKSLIMKPKYSSLNIRYLILKILQFCGYPPPSDDLPLDYSSFSLSDPDFRSFISLISSLLHHTLSMINNLLDYIKSSGTINNSDLQDVHTI